MPGLDALHLLEEVVRPALQSMGPQYASVSAEQIVMGTAAVESHLIWLRQMGSAPGGGPARGLWQMEKPTLYDLMARCPGTTWTAIYVMTVSQTHDALFNELAWNLRFAAAMCRLKYRDDPHPLPEPGDVHRMAALWKFRYNSMLGAGKIEDFERSWASLIAPRYKEMWPNAN